ncbi:putative sulfate exporter family transporter [Campylobacter upsaliensis]|uniref:putative sulfate exporter family transporter n=1 Tax=Campylobacter upsaliensis TaxID=28080 RepID=UPI001F526C95|nr:putative sulfate exporter family transporter [Campylobacter upsaliensis]
MSWVRQELFLLTQEVALIVKMIRVILLVAVLLIVPYFFAQSKSVGSFIYLGLPFGFLGVVALHSFAALLVEFFKFLSSFFLVMAMSALRLQVDLKAF